MNRFSRMACIFLTSLFCTAMGPNNSSQSPVLLAWGNSIPPPPRISSANPLIDASIRGDAVTVQALLSQGGDLNAKDEYNATALMEACRFRHVDVVRLLLAKGADINFADAGMTALMFASQEPDTDVVRVLLDNGADVDAKRDDDGWTALMLASEHGYVDVVRALLSGKANVNAIGRDKDCVQFQSGAIACAGPTITNAELIAMFPQAVLQRGKAVTALSLATENGHSDIADLLAKAGAK